MGDIHDGERYMNVKVELEGYVRGIYAVLVHFEDQLDVNVRIEAGKIIVSINAHPDDRGIVLGKRGGIIDGVRLLVRAWCKKHIGMESEVKVI
jgi:predicted RNA-binding protein YlqC (UPF0109 family)